MNIEFHDSAGEIALEHIALGIAFAIRQFTGGAIRAGKAKRSRTTADDIEAQVLARFHFFVRSGLDHLIDHGVARAVIAQTIAVRILELLRHVAVEGERAVGEGHVDVARLEPFVIRGPVFAAGNEYGAEPVLVVAFTVFAGAC